MLITCRKGSRVEVRWLYKNEGAVPHKTDFVPQEELKSNHSVGEREVTKQRNLDRVRIRDPANRKRIVSTHHLIPTMHIWPSLIPRPHPLTRRNVSRKPSRISWAKLNFFVANPLIKSTDTQIDFTVIREVLCKNY